MHLCSRAYARRGALVLGDRAHERRPAWQARVARCRRRRCDPRSGKCVEEIRRDVEARLVVDHVADHEVAVGILLGAIAVERDAARRALDADAAAEEDHLAAAGDRVGRETGSSAAATSVHRVRVCPAAASACADRNAHDARQRERDLATRRRIISRAAGRRSCRRTSARHLNVMNVWSDVNPMPCWVSLPRVSTYDVSLEIWCVT